MYEIIIGIISGIVSGMGMGGGTILILALSTFFGINQHVAQATNLVFFIPTSLVAIFVSLRTELIEWKTGNIIMIFGIVGAIIRSENIISNGC